MRRTPQVPLTTMALELSVVVPMYDEEAVLPLFVERLRPVLDGLGVGYEVVCVDDGSRDGTATAVEDARTRWPQLRLVRLLRNSGHQAALSAGYERARGAYVVTMDADLQDPPETIREMLEVARSRGVDVVYGVRDDRSTDSFLKRGTARLYYRVMRRLAGEQVPSDVGDFRLVSRRVVDAITALPEHSRVYRLLIPWFGFPSAEVAYSRERRAAGKSKYPVVKMLRLGLDSVTTFSAAPLQLATWAGLFGGFLCLVAMAWSVLAWLTGSTVAGWTSTMGTVGLIGATQLICIGLLGEYLSRLFIGSQGRPSYLVGYDSADSADSADGRADRVRDRVRADGPEPSATPPEAASLAGTSPQPRPPAGQR
jgi:glycosyltransferase involved in cell wall biosynthesis